MEKMNFREDEKGVSVVIGVVLLLAIAVVVVPIIYRHYVKTSMTGNESDHMDRVKKQFFELQSKVSWMDEPEDAGEIMIPMNSGSVRFSIVQSPAGTLAVNQGNDIKVETTLTQENIIIDSGTIKFVGQNLYYPDQSHILEGGHVFMVQDGVELLASSNEDLIRWNGGLKVKTYKIGKENSSVSSSGTEALTLSWGGRERYPENKKLENSDNIRINFKTKYKNVWKSYLDGKTENIEKDVDNVQVGTYLNGVYLQIENEENLNYLVSVTEIGGDTSQPKVETLADSDVSGTNATLKMNYDFKDYAYGDVRFKWRKSSSESWSYSSWTKKFGRGSYSETITGLSPSTTYYYRAQIRFESSTEEGSLENFTTGVGDGGGLGPPYVPKAPENLTASSPDSTQIHLDWDHEEGTRFDYYNIYRSTESDFTNAVWINNTTSKNYTDTGLATGTTYYYKVTAVDLDGNESNPSNKASASTGANLSPTADFTYSPDYPAEGESITFDASGSSDPDGSIVSYEWDWTNDGTFDSTGEIVTHSYSPDNTYTVKLRVTDDNGATDTITQDIIVGDLNYNGDAIATDGVDSPTPDRSGGVEFSITNTFATTVTVDSIVIDPADDIIEISDTLPNSPNPEDVEIYVSSDVDAYTDYGGGADIPNGGLTVQVGYDGSYNSGNSPEINSNNIATFYFYEFYRSRGGGSQNADMSGETIEITINYTVGGESKSKTFTITPS